MEFSPFMLLSPKTIVKIGLCLYPPTTASTGEPSGTGTPSIPLIDGRDVINFGTTIEVIATANYYPIEYIEFSTTEFCLIPRCLPLTSTELTTAGVKLSMTLHFILPIGMQTSRVSMFCTPDSPIQKEILIFRTCIKFVCKKKN